MAVFTLKNTDIYYETYGKGEPLVLLNGIMMSTNSWAPFKRALSANHQLILLDFIDQGKSGHVEGDYDQSLMVEVLHGLLGHLAVTKANILGISYGGEVAMHFALAHPDMVESLMLFNTTPVTTAKLRGIGEAWKKAGLGYDGELFFNVCLPSIYSRVFYESHEAWINERIGIFAKSLPNAWYDGFLRLVNSADYHDVRPSLGKLDMPVMVVTGSEDDLTPQALQAMIVEACPQAVWHVVKGAGHALMYEAPEAFLTLTLGFLASYKTTIKL